MNTYISILDYLRAPSGHDTSTLVGNVATLSAAVTAGVMSLSLNQPLTAAQSTGDRVTIFDGSSSEVVTLTLPADVGATTLQCTAVAAAHAAGTPICTDGSGGSLADMIVNASAQIEAFCRQPLLQTTHVNEVLPLRTMRAAVTRDYGLTLRPKQFPVTTVTAATIVIDATTRLTLDVSQAFIDVDAQLVSIATLTTTSGTSGFWGLFGPAVARTQSGFVQLSYTAGYLYASLPSDVRQACTWLVSDLLSDRRNPTGAAEVKLGDVQLVTRLRGETTGRSVLVMRAESALTPYRQRPF